MNKIIAYTILVACFLWLGMNYYLPKSGIFENKPSQYEAETERRADINLLTSEYNRGFITGRYQAFAELYHCGEPEAENETVIRNYHQAYQFMIDNGYETYMPCGE